MHLEEDKLIQLKKKKTEKNPQQTGKSCLPRIYNHILFALILPTRSKAGIGKEGHGSDLASMASGKPLRFVSPVVSCGHSTELGSGKDFSWMLLVHSRVTG